MLKEMEKHFLIWENKSVIGEIRLFCANMEQIYCTGKIRYDNPLLTGNSGVTAAQGQK